MDRCFSVIGDQTAGANQSIVAIGNGAAVTYNAHLYELIVSSITTAPADANIRFRMRKYTAAGTATSVVPEPLDPDLTDDMAAISSGYSNHTVEPTYTGVAYLDFGMNQRNTWRWIARPGGEVIVKKAKSNGIGVECVSINTGTPELSANVHFKE